MKYFQFWKYFLKFFKNNHLVSILEKFPNKSPPQKKSYISISEIEVAQKWREMQIQCRLGLFLGNKIMTLNLSKLSYWNSEMMKVLEHFHHFTVANYFFVVELRFLVEELLRRALWYCFLFIVKSPKESGSFWNFLEHSGTFRKVLDSFGLFPINRNQYQNAL